MATGKNQKCVNVNIENWLKKVNLTKLALTQAVARAVDFGMDKVHSETAKNLDGPSYGSYTTKKGNKVYKRGPLTNAGVFPVPKQSGQLANSLNWMRLSPTVGAVFTDKRKCKYNELVHDGGKAYYFGREFYMKPRRYLGHVVTIWRPRIHIEMKRQILEAVRKAGQR